MTLIIMEDGLDADDKKSIKMGASSNPNASRLATLQEKRRTLEETIAKRNQELRQLCLKEYELTGITPIEMPLEPGESPLSSRKKVGTSYQLSQNLINNINNEEDSIASLELQMQVQANMAEAALGLASEANISKTLRRQHMSQYSHHRQQYNLLEEKLTFLKTKIQTPPQQSPSPNYSQPPKHKKKPRPSEQDDTVSMNINMNDPFGKTVLRHSMRSLQHPMINTDNEQRFSSHPKLTYRNSDNSLHTENTPHLRHEDILISNFYKMNLNKNVDRRDIGADNLHSQGQQYNHSYSNPNLYQQPGMQYAHTSYTLPHRSTQILPPSIAYDLSSHSELHQPQFIHDYHQYNNNSHMGVHGHLTRQSSPSTSSNAGSHRFQYYPSHTVHGQPSYYYNAEQQLRILNPHQIQPHQQYEHDVMASGLGGFWKQSENGEMIWCNSSNLDNIWQRDKRCGSLDRRKNKRLHKRISPNVVDPKSATILPVTSAYTDTVQNAPAKVQQNLARNRQDSRQLVRTQSLGSVGIQTVDGVWPSDDNSSCGSDTHVFNDLSTVARKQKQKEWYETSLDDPVPMPGRIVLRSHSTLPSISPEEKYMELPPTAASLSSPKMQKPVLLEIPAESKPSPRVIDTNIELFNNNNIPKNCTIVQAGQCKPYHEETKPFEMADFYKYSTKFNKSPAKHQDAKERALKYRQTPSPQGSVQQNLNDNFDDDTSSVIQKSIYQPLQPMTCQPFSPTKNSAVIRSPSSLNTSLDLSRLTPNVAETFSSEMNAWYLNHREHDIENDGGSKQTSRARSTATLV